MTAMLELPRAGCSLLVRTDFASDAAWRQITAAAEQENADGFRPYLQTVSDRAFERASWQDVKAAVPPDEDGAAVLFIADEAACAQPGHPVLVVDLLEDRPPFRCVMPELWAIDNNLNIANMDWEDFAESAGDDGVYRG
jgi:hypothetical protein